MSRPLVAGAHIRSDHPAGAAAASTLRGLSSVPQSTPAIPVGLLVALLATLALVGTLMRFDVPLVLAAMIVLVAGVALACMPQVATLLMVFLLYTNIPAVASRFHGVPRVVAGSFILLLAIPLVHHTIIRGERLRTDRAFAGMLAFMGVMLLASLRARGMGFAVERMVSFAIEGLLLYWLVLNVIRDMATLRRVLWTLLAAGGLLGALTAYQEVTGSLDQQFGGLAHRNYDVLVAMDAVTSNPDDPAAQAQLAEILQTRGGNRSRRAEGPMDEPNRFAQTMVVLLPIVAFACRTARTRTARLLAAASGALILGAIVYSSSRGGLLAVGVLVICALLLRWLRPIHLLVALLLLVPSMPVIAPQAFERIATISSAVGLLQGRPTAQADGAIRGRMTEMLAAAQVFLDYPVLGVGPGQYRPYYSKEYHQKNPRLVFRHIPETRRAHTLYLELAAELGIIGVAVFLAIVVILMRELGAVRRQWASRPAVSDLATALQLSIVAYLTTAIFLHMAFERYLWFLLALAGVVVQVARPSRPRGISGAAPHVVDGGTLRVAAHAR